MRPNVRIIISLSIAASLSLGIVGAGCKKAAPKGEGSREISSAGAPTSVSPADLAKAELAKLQQQAAGTGAANGAAPGTVTGSAPASTAAATKSGTVVASAPTPPLEPTCFTEVFHHKAMPGHSDEESCSRHKNLLKLSHSNINPAHVCVRVNGAPVKFERKGDEIRIGSIAGPKAKITVRYCTGKLTCAEVAKEDCTVPKDEFMEALGGDSGGPNDQTAQWESAESVADSKLNAEVKKELADIDEVNTNENERSPASSHVFKDWVRDEDSPACSKKRAS